jgi:hypothetical protein
MTGNTRFGRGRYNLDYAPDAAGNYRYVGSKFRVDLPKKRARGRKTLLAALWALSAAAFALGGASNGDAARTLWALLPLMCCLMPVFYFALGLAKWLYTKEDLTRKGLDESINRMKHSAVGLVICAGLALAGGIGVCALRGALEGELSFLAAALALLGIGIAERIALVRTPILEIPRAQWERNA